MTVEGLEWTPRWVTHLGALKGCAEHLGIEISDGWLYGGSGHAFLLCIHPVLCPSGPTSWEWRILMERLPGLGLRLEGVQAFKHAAADFPGDQRRAWDLVREALDRGLPCYGWEIWLPEFYVIRGYDEKGYIASGPGAPPEDQTRPWPEVGASEIGVLHVHRVERGEAAPDREVVRAALELALRFARDPGDWVDDSYRTGPVGLEAWAEALERGEALQAGHSYNAEVYRECRLHGQAFLEEIQERLPGLESAPLEEARTRFARVLEHLHALTEEHPFQGPESDWEALLRSPEAADRLREAAKEERLALDALERILASL